MIMIIIIVIIINMINNPLETEKNALLRVISSLTHYSDIVSDVSPGSMYGRCILTFFLAYTVLHLFWHSFWHSTWHMFWHTFWHIFWHSFWRSNLAFCLASIQAFILAFSLACVRVQAWPTASGTGKGYEEDERSTR